MFLYCFKMYEERFRVYILASGHNGTLYVGMTGNLSKRIHEHREGLIPGFTKRYGVKRLVWYESFPRAREAIAFEKRLKRWRRRWKLELIEARNPQWDDLYPTLYL
jgi:putative endonuclease